MPSIVKRFGAAFKAFRLGGGIDSSASGGWGGVGGDTKGAAKLGDFLKHSGPVYACANLRARNLGGLPVKLYKRDQKGQRVEVTNGRGDGDTGELHTGGAFRF